MPGAEAAIQYMPAAIWWLCACMLHMAGDCRCDDVEMPCVQERSAVSQLCRTIATGGGPASPAAQQIDVALAGEIEAMAIAADERAFRDGQIKPANRTAK